jgi:predicted nucleic acid-binding Zn ribbon protein
MKREKKDNHISSVIDAMYKRYHLDSKLDELHIERDWESIVGKLFAKYTTELSLKGKTLYIKVDNPVLKNELFLQRNELLGKVNEFYQRVVVEKIFVSS